MVKSEQKVEININLLYILFLIIPFLLWSLYLFFVYYGTPYLEKFSKFLFVKKKIRTQEKKALSAIKKKLVDYNKEGYDTSELDEVLK